MYVKIALLSSPLHALQTTDYLFLIGQHYTMHADGVEKCAAANLSIRIIT